MKWLKKVIFCLKGYRLHDCGSNGGDWFCCFYIQLEYVSCCWYLFVQK